MSENFDINPWLLIPHDDYEAHMSDDNVQQLQVLRKIFSDAVEKYSPKSVAVLGCAGGNGFENLIDKKLERIVGVDINKDYLAICRNRFHASIPNLELLCSDLHALALDSNSFDYIHAALIFEYVEVEKVIKKISNWLKAGSILCSVIQLPSDLSAPVSKTSCESLKLLTPLLKLVEPDELISAAEKNNLSEFERYFVELKMGKKFLVQFFKKSK